MRPIAPDLFVETKDGPRLLGGRRKTDGKIVFPLPAGAERAYFETIELSPTGKLWSWTVQRFRPKSPPYAGDEDEKNFKPFALGYVELPGEIIVESRLEFAGAEPRIGAPMRLELVPFNLENAQATTYQFRLENAHE